MFFVAENIAYFSAQIKYYTELISKKDDWEYAGICEDEAWSGTKLQKRDEFLRRIKDSEAGKVDMIITKSVTRFTRNTLILYHRRANRC
ncbi:recombinase family protein [Aminipila terrae]|uniref:recombinase family protein n=1 Tax=Aminipila terrae TaxID=2697030 RepID=UPI002ED2E043